VAKETLLQLFWFLANDVFVEQFALLSVDEIEKEVPN